jgi:NTE family protein
LERCEGNPPAGLRKIDLCILRPSMDLGKLARELEPSLPRPFRWLTRRLGTQRSNSNDLLSLVMFQPDYIARLISLGEEDARARAGEIEGFLERLRNAAD